MKSYKNNCECGKKINFDGLVYPADLRTISKFEISINVFGLKGAEIVGPLHYTSKKQVIHINLLCFSNELNQNYHYAYIRTLSRLVSSQVSKTKTKSYICDGCLVIFKSSDDLAKHEQEDCLKIKTRLPPANSTIQFEHWERTMKVN